MGGSTRPDANRDRLRSATRDRHPLRFFANGDPLAEAAWRSQWISAEVPAAQRERIANRQAAPPDLIVVQPVKDWTCAECGGTGNLLVMDDIGPLCLICADMDHLVFLPAGRRRPYPQGKEGQPPFGGCGPVEQDAQAV